MREDQVHQGPGGGDRRYVSRLRERLRATPGSRLVYRLSVGVVGAAVVFGGLVLVPLPGPGWLIVFVGLAILASEFAWAQRLLDFAREKVKTWTHWLGRQSVWIRLAVGAATACFVGAVVWGLAVWRGVPSWVTNVVQLPFPLG